MIDRTPTALSGSWEYPELKLYFRRPWVGPVLGKAMNLYPAEGLPKIQQELRSLRMKVLLKVFLRIENEKPLKIFRIRVF